MSAPALDLCLGISQAHARLQLALDDALGTWHGIAHADFILLHTLARAEGGCLPTTALVAPLGVPLSAVVRRVIPLEKTGHIARDAGQVSLRPAGRAVLAEARATAGALCADVLHGLPEGAADAAATLLNHLAPAGAAGLA